MTASAITRPGERDRWTVKLGEIDWLLVLVLSLIAGAGGAMLYSIAGGRWAPWAIDQLSRYGVFLVRMLILGLTDLRVWFAAAYPVYVIALLLLIAVPIIGESSLGAKRWLDVGVRFQPSEVMKIGLVLALARFYHGISADEA